MRRKTVIGAAVTMALVGVVMARSGCQSPTVRDAGEQVLREYTGVHSWDADAFVYLQLWNEFSGFDKPGQLVAFDESGEVRVLHPSGPDQFFAGPGAAVSKSVESRIEFQRDAAGRVTSLTWRREAGPARMARRVDIEKREVVRFANGDVQLAGTLITPA